MKEVDEKQATCHKHLAIQLWGKDGGEIETHAFDGVGEVKVSLTALTFKSGGSYHTYLMVDIKRFEVLV